MNANVNLNFDNGWSNHAHDENFVAISIRPTFDSLKKEKLFKASKIYGMLEFDWWKSIHVSVDPLSYTTLAKLIRVRRIEESLEISVCSQMLTPK